ncbi:MAG: efflux RND transporter periplasmic adaptor subunit, partial [Deltaproteobacteria bacterium]|nr:efflux RND transporter periplasmic adaptor subunit [Deltaproteobacteria bacterium]
ESLPVDIGDRLKKGHILFRIREVDYELAYRQAEANLTRAAVILKDRKREKKRMQNLFKAGSATQQAWDRAITAYEEAEAALSLAQVARDITRQSLTDCTIRAPYDCVVTARFIEQGEYAKKGNTIVEIMDLTVLNAELELPERYAGKIVKGLVVRLTVNSGSGPVMGEIVAVNPKIDQTSRTFLIKVAVDNRDGKLQSGLFCSALFRLPPQRGQTAIPKAALSKDEGRSTVWIVKNGKVFKKIIRTGDAIGDWVPILDGLQPGDMVVVEGAGGLLEGVQVVVINQIS